MPLSDVMSHTYSGRFDNIPDISVSDKKFEPKRLKDALQAGLFLTDWAQTRNIAQNPDKFYETNKILGRHPHKDKVDAYFALTGLAQLYAADKLPGKWRDRLQNLVIGVESGYVGNNYKLGIKAKF